jgi:hypothetical protein
MTSGCLPAAFCDAFMAARVVLFLFELTRILSLTHRWDLASLVAVSFTLLSSSSISSYDDVICD